MFKYIGNAKCVFLRPSFTDLIQLCGGSEPGRPAAHDRDRLARPLGGRVGHHPTVGPRRVYDRILDVLDSDRRLTDGKDTRTLATNGRSAITSCLLPVDHNVGLITICSYSDTSYYASSIFLLYLFICFLSLP